MIQVIGIRRVVVLFLLASVNVVLGAAVYLYMMPEKQSTERKLRVLKSQVNRVEADIDDMRLEFEQLDKQQAHFDDLKERGFFSVQDRSDARTLFSVVQRESGVISALVNVKPGVIVDYPEARKANHKVLLSLVEVKIKAFDDASIYRYIEIAEKVFPGHLSLDNIEMKRTRDVNAPVLRAIASGANPELVSADMRMSWRTVIPESQVIVE